MSSIPSNPSSNPVPQAKLSDDPLIEKGLSAVLQNKSALKGLDTDGLLTLSTLNSKWNHEVIIEPKSSPWPEIANRIPEVYPPKLEMGKLIDEDLHEARERFSFVQNELQDRFKGFGAVLSTPYSYLSTEKINELFKVRDTLIVWEILADQISSSVLNDAYENLEISTYTDIIRFTNQFDSWVDENFSALNEIQELDLSDQALTSLPRSIGKMTSIATLNLQENSLTSLPSSIGHLTNLEHLNLMDNELTSLPDKMGYCSALRTLECNNNPLSSLPASFIRLVNLRVVFFYGNAFTSLPSVLGSCVKLKHLGFGDIITKAPAEIPDSWSNLTKLEQVSLTDCKFTSVPDFICGLGNLINLNLNFNRITRIPDNLEDLNLEELELDQNPLEYIPEGLKEFWPEDYQAPESPPSPLKRARLT